MTISKLELMNTMEKIAPSELAEPWDNCGMQIDLGAAEINKILITLEITTETVTEAEALGVDFIVTHHPLFFSPIKQIDGNNFTGNNVINLIRKGISVFSAHTNFDKAEKGNNFSLAELLKLKKVIDLNRFGMEYIGVFGELSEKKSIRAFMEDMQRQVDLKSSEIRLIGNPEAEINKIGLCTGAGIGMLEIAAANGCQLFVTGDVKYHDGIKAKEMGINVIDAGHYGTEKIFVPNMAKQLTQAFGNKVQIFESKVDINPFDFF
ncbi:Nif3-like dinuclear metal center hexameric protein [Aminipila sp.]|uniref:Nif3-like dinuclear metal center hexameric protein n=1 Tax=Aminipila sp. TaxID=2060095 RepID=UPI0028A21913|nr:Nif3-like dinuclear metal center hexameric protein [Aminipila sp.]